MVLSFSMIPRHLQRNIAEKMDFFDLKQMELSSTQGKEAVALIKIIPVVEGRLFFSQGNGTAQLIRPDSAEVLQKDLNALREDQNLPRFSVNGVMVTDDVTPEAISAPVLNNRESFMKSEVAVGWYFFVPKPMEIEIMNKISELFTIGEFRAIRDLASDPTFISLPVFRQVKVLYCDGSQIPDDIFLTLKASTMNIGPLTSFPNMGPTLRRYVEQFFLNEREIHCLNLLFDGSQPGTSFEEMFAGMEYRLLWSWNTHESSDFAHIPRANLSRGLESNKYYLIRGGEKKLFFVMNRQGIHARKTLDENQDVLN